MVCYPNRIFPPRVKSSFWSADNLIPEKPHPRCFNLFLTVRNVAVNFDNISRVSSASIMSVWTTLSSPLTRLAGSYRFKMPRSGSESCEAYNHSALSEALGMGNAWLLKISYLLRASRSLETRHTDIYLPRKRWRNSWFDVHKSHVKINITLTSILWKKNTTIWISWWSFVEETPPFTSFFIRGKGEDVLQLQKWYSAAQHEIDFENCLIVLTIIFPRHTVML